MEQSIILITGFSGAGKTTLYENLMTLHGDQLHKVISSTTRQPRPGEEHGRDYHFITKEEFLERQESGHFLEFSEHYGNFYGSTSPDHLELAQGKVPLYVLDPKGMHFFKQRFPNVHPFFLHISKDEQLKRLMSREANQDLILERLGRYHIEEQILEASRDNLHILPNETIDDLNNAVEYIRRTLQLG